MTSTATDIFAVTLANFIANINDHCNMLSSTQQPFGMCIATPKSPFITLPTKEIHVELENRVKEFFKDKQLVGIYLRYFLPPLMPIPQENNPPKTISADDYQLTLDIPQFDNKWQQTVIARNLIYCPLDPEVYEYQDWFELQEETIRLVPLVNQTVNELEIIARIECTLRLSAISVFDSFIYEYGLTDQHQPMSQDERKKWQSKKIKWQDRYKLVAPIIKPAKTVHDLYKIARQKAATSRNPILKSLFWAFVKNIENNLIIQTRLPEEIKKYLLDKLRQTKKRVAKGKYVAKRRPAISVSDIECGQMLYVMIRDYLNSKKIALVEAVFFVWIAQHGAFSGHHLTVDSILSIKKQDINFDDMTILVQAKEIYLTDGLNNMLSAWIESAEGKKRRKLFQNITNDSLEDIINKYSQELYDKEKRLLPRDFLEKVHVVPGVRMPLDLRRKIIAQEELIKESPYRIKSDKIKNDILASIKKKTLKT